MADMTDHRQDFERKSRQAFEESVAALDGETRSRLARVRQNALAEARRGFRPSLSTWVPIGAAAAATVLAIALWSGGPGPQATEPALAALEEFDIVMAGDDLDMMDEDPAFYAWAVEEITDGVG